MRARNVIHDMLLRHPVDNPALVVRSKYNEKFYTYGNLTDRARIMANHLVDSMGISPGDTVGLMLDKDVELMTSHLASWCIGAQTLPLFTLFGREAVAHRVNHSQASLVISQRKYERALSDLRCPVIYVDDKEHRASMRQCSNSALPHEGQHFNNDNDVEVPLSLLYTSGTTGAPKGVQVTCGALESFEVYMQCGLGLREDSEYLNMADPAWAYGLYYSLMGPLLMGAATRWLNMRANGYALVEWCYDHQISCLAGSPSHYRMMQEYECSDDMFLEQVSSAGEPLPKAIYDYAQEKWGVPIYDHYGQTETGMLLCNHWDLPESPEAKEGTVGSAMPGFDVQLDSSDRIVVATNSPLFWFTGYYTGKDTPKEAVGHWYNTGDTATMDEENRFSFGARVDDIITSSGYRIGPFEIEDLLQKQPGVAEAAVIGVPDEVRGEIVVAFVVAEESAEELTEEALQNVVKEQLSKHLYPRSVIFVDSFPKTPSLKVQRNLLKEQFLESYHKD